MKNENENETVAKENVENISKETPKSKKDLKSKLMLNLSEDHPFSHLQIELKKRGVKHLDLNSLLIEVFEQIPQTWWDKKLDDMTPLEFKVSQALADPSMRKKFGELLT